MYTGFGYENKKERDPAEDLYRWEDNIKMDLRETEWGYGLDSFGSGWGTMMGSC
jgi:hypothetical protein